MSDESLLMEDPYRIDSVTPSNPPSGMVGADWHCYVIVQGSNSIRGFRPGSHRAVTNAVQEIVAQLNERRFGKRAARKTPAKKR
ncbi:MAG: hypothetical protein OEM51_07555 [Gammaproteobacteria bacterium]|nr:hypothetical protein [Gammaproteobacteria bacterium]MDH3431119.1 hypothetical protein [Gammaproteobacteria bacterium]